MKRGGFTLVELLIAMILMIILLGAISMVFGTTTEVVNISEARINVYDQARKTIDVMETDVQGMLPFNQGVQRLVMENGFSSTGGSPPTYGSGNHVGNAADRFQFRTNTMAGDTIQQVEVTYELMPYSDSTRRAGIRTGRPMFVLIRRLRGPNPTQPNMYNQPVFDSTGTTVVPDQELCHFVVSFNIEFYASNRRFSQLDPSPCPPTDPLGDGLGDNDNGQAHVPYRIPYIRVIMSIVDDMGERQERVIPRVIWIPGA